MSSWHDHHRPPPRPQPDQRATRVPKTEITGLFGALLKRMTRKQLGAVPEPAKVFWHHRKVLMDMGAFGRKVQKWDHLDADLKTFAHMAVAAQVGCSWCLDLNYFLAHNEGIDERQGQRGAAVAASRRCSARSSATSWSTPRR